MPISEENKVSYVTWDGRTIVNTEALLQDPKVREAMSKLARSIKRGRAEDRAAKTRFPKKP